MSSSDGGKRILASTSGAETKRELSRARGETRSWRQLREDMSDEDSGARCFMRYGAESEEFVEVRPWWTGAGFSGRGRAFSSLLVGGLGRAEDRDMGKVSCAVEPLDTTVERQGRLFRTGILEMKGTTSVGRFIGVPRTIVSLELPDECCVLIVSVLAMGVSVFVIAVSLRLFLRELFELGGRACGVRHLSRTMPPIKLL
jgi:hypothetical protein